MGLSSLTPNLGAFVIVFEKMLQMPHGGASSFAQISAAELRKTANTRPVGQGQNFLLMIYVGGNKKRILINNNHFHGFRKQCTSRKYQNMPFSWVLYVRAIFLCLTPVRRQQRSSFVLSCKAVKAFPPYTCISLVPMRKQYC